MDVQEPTDSTNEVSNGSGDFIGVKNKILTLTPIVLCGQEDFEFSSLLSGNELSVFTLLNNLSIEIFCKNTLDVKFAIKCDDSSLPRNYKPLVEAEISLLNDADQESTVFKLSDRLYQNNEFVTSLCSLEVFRPFYRPEGLKINLSLKISDNEGKTNPLNSDCVENNEDNLGAMLLANTNTADLTLQCQGEDVRCHRAVLMSVSAVFARKLQNMPRTDAFLVHMTLPGLQMFLRLTYGAASTAEKKGIGITVALELLKAGGKYEIQDIQDLALNILQDEPEQNIPIEVIFEMFTRCKKMGIQTLMEKAVRVFKMKGNEFVRTPEFAKISREQTDSVQEIIALSLQF